MDIKIKGADFAPYAAGVVTPTVKGFPAPSLAALYLFNDLAPGSTVSGAITDESGGGHDASRVTVEASPSALSAAPVAQGFGLEVTDIDGLVLNTGLTFPTSGCVVAALKNTVSDAVTQFATWAKPSGSHFPAVKTGSYSSNGSDVIPAPKLWINSVHAFHRQHVAYSTNGNKLPAPGAFAAVGDPLGTNNWNVAAFAWDNALGRVRLQTVNGGDTGWISDPGMIGYWTAFAAAKLYVGLWPHGQDTNPATGHLGGFAVYSALIDDQARQWAMDAMARTMIGRGYSILGFGE